MIDLDKKNSIQLWDEKKKIIILSDLEGATEYSAAHFIELAQEAIDSNDKFTVALSGGSTPKKIYSILSKKYKSAIDWSKVFLFFSDERMVPMDHPDSNYKMAMDAGLSTLAIPKDQIFPMATDKDIKKCVEAYEKQIEEHVGPDLFDLVMLGVGEDGHTASLFPETEALEVHKKAVVSNFVPHKASWRITLTFNCINNSSHICFYVLGTSKQDIVQRIFQPPKKSPILPAELVGSEMNPSLWILDEAAAAKLLKSIS